MINKIRGFFSRKQEIVYILSISIIIILGLIFLVDTIQIYNSESLNKLILSIFGTLFGLLLTSYAILFGLIPALSIDTLETKALENLNFRFFLALIINLFIIILGFMIVFIDNIYLIYVQLLLVTYLILMFLLLIFYLFLLFKGARNKAIKDKLKKLNLS